MDNMEARSRELVAKTCDLTDAEFTELEDITEKMLNREGETMNPVLRGKRCPVCGGKKMQFAGKVKTKRFGEKQRVKCVECGSVNYDTALLDILSIAEGVRRKKGVPSTSTRSL